MNSLRQQTLTGQSFASGASTVRRYGKHKYTTTGTEISSVISDTGYKSQIYLPSKTQIIKRSPDHVEPIFQSIKRNMNERTNKYTKTKVYDYTINPDAAAQPDDIATFRDKNYNRYNLRVDTFRPESKIETPSRPKLNFSVLANSLRSSSARKTVRFAESAEGLLKAVPVDPTFNDSDFVYDMRHIID